MYLKRLELFGFKSFADKTELEFGPGIAAIIGPNGCGKSNIVDAVRWALGEQSVKALRGSRMEEIIFSGSESRKPLNYAEVSLTFGEAGNRLNLDYDEITVTRRLFRSGESEYLLNKAPCRLKDITELFLDTGIGKEIYSVVGQGRVEEIINSRPEDRREIFEEAAGILKYKLRKREARRRLEETRENLVRVQDLILELENQVSPLEEQAAVTRRYRALKERIDAVEMKLFSHHLQRTRSELEKIERKLRGVTDALAEAAARGGEREQHSQALKERQEELSRTREELERKVNRVTREIEQREGEQALLRERESRAREDLAENARRRTRLEELFARLKEQREKTAQELARKHESLEAEQAACAALRERLSELEKSGLLSEVEERQQELYRAEARLKAAEASVEEITQQAERLGRRLQALAAEEVEQARRLRELAPAGEELAARQRELAARLAAVRERQAQVEEEKKSLDRDRAALLELQQRRREELRGVKSRLQLLQEQESGLSGYYRGVREILRAKDSLPGIVGPVVDLLDVEERYLRAVEAALGGGLQFIVTETEASAREAIRFLKEENRGWATFLPLDTIRVSASEPERHHGWRELDGVLGKASELVKVKPAYQKVADYLLGTIVVCRDLAAASAAARFLQYGCRVISLEGDMFNPGGAIRGGSLPRRNAGLPLGRRKEIETLEREREALHKKMASGEEKMAETGRKIEQVEESAGGLRAEGEALEKLLDEARRAVEEREREKALLRERQAAAAAALRSARADEDDLRERRAELVRQAEACREEIGVIEAELAGKKELYRRSIEQKKELEESLTAALVRLNSCQEQEQALANSLIKVEEDLAGPRQEQEERETAAARLEAELARNRKALERASAALEELHQESAALLAALEGSKKEAGAAHALLVELEEEERRRRSRIGRLEKQERRLAVEQTRLKTELDYRLLRFREQFGSREPVQVDQEFDPAESEAAARALKEDLEGLGEVNLGAIEELERLRQRIDFLTAQRDDLRRGELSLRKILAEIDRRMEYFFTGAFEKIGTNMQSVFAELFEGGRVLLKLTDPDDVLESGIEIIAQPPGKKLQNISLLSTGEKVLTAVALIFAILRHKPAPFYLLDEIESALDDANLARFTAYLKRASREAQFILITHRKRTMEQTDFLYGVTMPELGVSRLVSMKLDEKAG